MVVREFQPLQDFAEGARLSMSSDLDVNLRSLAAVLDEQVCFQSSIEKVSRREAVGHGMAGVSRR
jgi:hypothetical protein